MAFEKIIKDLENKLFSPVYFLQGEEPYFIDEITEQIEKEVLTETEKEFNQTIVYGRDTDIPTLISYAKRFPMMANHQVVIVKEAQDLKKLDALESYIKQPLDSTILVLCYKYKKIDKRTKFGKSLSQNKKVVFFESSKLYDNKIPGWISDYLKKNSYDIDLNASAMLSENLGTDLSKIANELNKLIINLPAKTKITPDHIEQNIGISKEFNIFELQKAIGGRNILKANKIITYFAANLKENPMPKLSVTLFGYFQKILIIHYLKDRSKNAVASALSVNPYFADDYIQAAKNYTYPQTVMAISFLREADMKSKGFDNVSANDGELMKELIFKIMHMK